jgi:hypothetical protein
MKNAQECLGTFDSERSKTLERIVEKVGITLSKQKNHSTSLRERKRILKLNVNLS